MSPVHILICVYLPLFLLFPPAGILFIRRKECKAAVEKTGWQQIDRLKITFPDRLYIDKQVN